MKNKGSSMPWSRLRRFYGLFKKRNIILPMFREVFAGSYKIPVATLLLFIASLFYIVSPVDIIPDWIIGLGWIDDLLLFSYASKFLEKELEKYQQHKNYTEGKPVVLGTKWK